MLCPKWELSGGCVSPAVHMYIVPLLETNVGEVCWRPCLSEKCVEVPFCRSPAPGARACRHQLQYQLPTAEAAAAAAAAAAADAAAAEHH